MSQTLDAEEAKADIAAATIPSKAFVAWACSKCGADAPTRDNSASNGPETISGACACGGGAFRPKQHEEEGPGKVCHGCSICKSGNWHDSAAIFAPKTIDKSPHQAHSSHCARQHAHGQPCDPTMKTARKCERGGCLNLAAPGDILCASDRAKLADQIKDMQDKIAGGEIKIAPMTYSLAIVSISDRSVRMMCKHKHATIVEAIEADCLRSVDRSTYEGIFVVRASNGSELTDTECQIVEQYNADQAASRRQKIDAITPRLNDWIKVFREQFVIAYPVKTDTEIDSTCAKMRDAFLRLALDPRPHRTIPGDLDQ